jgi:hypothetical protein
LSLASVLLATFPLTITLAALTALGLSSVELNYAWVIVIFASGFGLANALGLSAGDVELGDAAGQWPIRLAIFYLSTYGPALFVSSMAVGVFVGWSITKVFLRKSA